MNSLPIKILVEFVTIYVYYLELDQNTASQEHTEFFVRNVIPFILSEAQGNWLLPLEQFFKNMEGDLAPKVLHHIIFFN